MVIEQITSRHRDLLFTVQDTTPCVSRLKDSYLLIYGRPASLFYSAVHSLQSTSACSRTVCVAFSCLSGG